MSSKYEAAVLCARSGCQAPARWVEVLVYIVTKERAPTARLCDGCAKSRRGAALVVAENEALARALLARHSTAPRESVEPEDFEVGIEAWG
jgi:hypothetical protein